MIVFTQEDVKKVMEELKRRLDMDIKEGAIPQNAKYIRAELASRMQGVYGTVMAVVPNSNWQKCVWWIDDELESLFAWYGLGELFNHDGTMNI